MKLEPLPPTACDKRNRLSEVSEDIAVLKVNRDKYKKLTKQRLDWQERKDLKDDPLPWE